MNFNKRKKVNPYWLLLFIFTCLFINSCRQGKPPKPPEVPISFKPIIGIGYTEVRRRLANGYSFDTQGFETEPSYRIKFLPNDSASVYSPDKKAFINFLVFLEPDSIFNVARSYFKLKLMSRDSLIFQVLEVQSDTLHLKHSLVYMTFYADDYIKKKKIDPAILGRPDKRDTLFIKERAALADKVPDSAFAARVPVTMKSKSPLVTVEKKEVKPDALNNYDASDGYMNPEFNITIHKAYDDFSYSFLVFVDSEGRMSFDRSLDYIMPEYKDATINTLKGITGGYLKFYLAVTPGTTLGIKHTSVVILNIVGRKN